MDFCDLLWNKNSFEVGVPLLSNSLLPPDYAHDIEYIYLHLCITFDNDDYVIMYRHQQ